jgi:hypothetical protein
MVSQSSRPQLLIIWECHSSSFQRQTCRIFEDYLSKHERMPKKAHTQEMPWANHIYLINKLMLTTPSSITLFSSCLRWRFSALLPSEWTRSTVERTFIILKYLRMCFIPLITSPDPLVRNEHMRHDHVNSQEGRRAKSRLSYWQYFTLFLDRSSIWIK